MQKLLSVPSNLVDYFYELEQVTTDEWFCTSDPVGSKLGSGGGTTWLLESCYRNKGNNLSFDEWLRSDKRILLHAGGQSRRLPGYAPSGKILTPIPVFRWERGQKLNQNLLSLQLPLYERILSQAPQSLHTLIASGDVYIRSDKPLQPIPEADVVCYGLWVDPSLATHHGVYVSERNNPAELDFMIQKPTLGKLEELSKTHIFLMDIGVWLLSDKAIRLLMQKSRKKDSADLTYYDLYSEFGLALGNHPLLPDPELNELSVAILPLQGGEFYHYGTSRELISSTLSLQNKVYDQRRIIHRKIKPNPAMFIQNSCTPVDLTAGNADLWIENSYVPQGWQLSSRHIITGVPVNQWTITLPEGVCVDIVPVGDKEWAVRPYGMNDAFRGSLTATDTRFLEKPFTQWMSERNLTLEDFNGTNTNDLQAAGIFPVVTNVEEMGQVLRWMVSEARLEAGKEIWKHATRLSADEIASQANLKRLYAQREEFTRQNWVSLAHNYEKSVFYQLDLQHAADEFVRLDLDAPDELPEEAQLMSRIHNHMLRSRINSRKGTDGEAERLKAFELLRDGLLGEISNQKSLPQLNVYSDQIVWGRSPVRIDVAGGWTDTPPYSLYSGGNVVNLAIELNGQPPLQVYIKPCNEHHIILRSIDMGAMEIIKTYEELSQYKKVGSPFSIPKAALVLAGFHPDFFAEHYGTLNEQLEAFGAGLEITLLAAIPSILASTVLGAVNDFCGLAWDKNEICRRTLVLEQLLTTGGGWQDQYGGVLHGIKLLQTEDGFNQSPQVRWLPDYLFSEPGFKECHLLYYTGITRTAKGILGEIVSSMFLNSSTHLSLLAEMKAHALDMAEAVQRGHFNRYATLVGKSWMQNKALDSGTNPPSVEAIIDRIKDYTLGYKLPGAGGGGYLYMVAKDVEAAARIKEILTNNPPNARARFVRMDLSNKGLQISRS